VKGSLDCARGRNKAQGRLQNAECGMLNEMLGASDGTRITDFERFFIFADSSAKFVTEPAKKHCHEKKERTADC
jgi:hypothetical protein